MQITRSVCRTVLVALLGIAFLAVTAHAQNIFGSIVGTVSDPGGAVLPGASVTVTNLGTGEKRTVTTDGQGNYQILSLPRGDYKVDVDSPGFKHFSRSPIDVVVDQQARVNVPMQIGEQSQQVVVNAAPPIMQTDSASLGQAVEGKAVQTLPLNGRNVLALVALVPGVVPQGSSSGNLTGQNVFAAGNYQIDGGNANESSVLVDGAPVNTSYGNTVELVMDQDVIQEFNAQTHNNTAEFGMYNGGVINMSTKSGTNAFHGTAYEYLRNTVLDANDFFANRTGAGREPWHQNQFGFNVGGPIMKNRLFFFGDYQGYRQTQGHLYFGNTPTLQELSGNFSALGGTGDTKPVIFDPSTTCGTGSNPACTPAQQNGTAPSRQPFMYNGQLNVIDPARFSTVAKSMIAFPYFATPNLAGTNNGTLNNWSKFGGTGGINDQFTIRGDQNLSGKQTMFERYTWWKSKNLPADPFGNGIITGDPISPEAFTTQQIVFGDTYVFNPTSVADIHLSWLRWNYERNPGHLGYNLNQLGFNPASDMGNISALNETPKSSGIPRMSLSNPNILVGGTGYIFSINNNYTIASTYQKIWKRHTFKFGLDLRRLEMDYYQNNNPGGVFTFDNVFTSQNTALPGATGNPIASFLIGDVATSGAQTEQISTPTFQTLYYQGYFAEDTWQVTNKLTATLGIRYEVPGVYVERHGWSDTFNPTEVNPIVGVPGAFDLVKTPQHPEAGVRTENWNDWSPRFGVAYRVTNDTVLRAGWGRFIAPADLLFGEAPLGAAVNFINNLMVNSIDGQQSPYNTLDNPYPNGLAGAPHRDPSYQQLLLGGNAQALNASEPNAETYQWNVAVEHQFPLGIALTAAWSGLRGDHLPVVLPRNPLPDSVISQAAADPTCQASLTKCFLNQQTSNPFYPHISQGVLQKATVTKNQLLRPFPQYGSILNTGSYVGISNYNALELKLQKRMANGGQILGSYSFSKLMTDAEYLTGWLDSTTNAGWQDYNNPMSNYSLSSFDARQRLVVSYMYPLPVGKGERFMNNMPAVANAVLGGWGLEGITTLQEGYPLGLSVQVNTLANYAFQGTERPNVVAGCSKAIGGSIQGRVNKYFNTACFTTPANFTYGNESRTDNQLRTPGAANWDMSLFKDFPVHESMAFDFRVEAFNIFNRAQFGSPNSSVGNPQFGQITSQYNNPRILQVSGRFNF
jgi:outer membrane receptor protein involved in Fe transport